jgi:hypothetical protein
MHRIQFFLKEQFDDHGSSEGSNIPQLLHGFRDLLCRPSLFPPRIIYIPSTVVVESLRLPKHLCFREKDELNRRELLENAETVLSNLMESLKGLLAKRLEDPQNQTTEQSFRRFDGMYAILRLWTCVLEYCPLGGATLTDGLSFFQEAIQKSSIFTVSNALWYLVHYLSIRMVAQILTLFIKYLRREGSRLFHDVFIRI